MLAIAISLLFGLAALTAIMVIQASLAHGSRRARQIVAELAAGETRSTPAIPATYRERVLPPLFAAA